MRRSRIFNDHQVTVNLIGAANRVAFAELLQEAALKLDLFLELHSIERFERVPIASVAHITTSSHEYHSAKFQDFLNDFTLVDRGLILPLMDRAIAPVIKCNGRFTSPVNEVSLQVLNKLFLKQECEKIGVATPSHAHSGIVHKRPIYGNGGSGAGTANMDLEDIDESKFLYEEIVLGPEVSIDAYVFVDGTYAAIARDRLRIVGGEVQHTRTRELTTEESNILLVLLSYFPLRGPLNLQFKGKPLKLLEINPRLGGGSTASIRAGWHAPRWLLEEYCLEIGASFREPIFQHVEVNRSWQDFVWRL